MNKLSDESIGREQWKTFILEQQASGLSVQAFCDLKKLGSSRFYYYRSILFPVPKKAKVFVQAKLPALVKKPSQLTATLYMDSFSLELTGELSAAYLAELCLKIS